MTLARCKENLIEIIADSENRVTALSGKWGTGKSHLWREVQKTSSDEKVKSAVYVSLFGLSSIIDLKLKVAQGALSKIKAGSELAESLKDRAFQLKNVLKKLSSRFSALDELAVLAVPMMIKGSYIVIDDIERKHANLSIDEILGFIDDCVQNLDCRFLLVLNSDELADKELWELFREKLIDHELRLDTSPSEAFDIAAKLTPTDYAGHIKPAVIACHITNIRIVRKIIRVCNRLLGNRGQLSHDVLSRVIPSVTVLSAINYKGLDGGPNFDFVLNFSNMPAEGTTKPDGEDSPEVRDKESWTLLLDKLGIRGTDDFEVLVVDYLKSGLIESASVDRIIDRFLDVRRELATRERLHDFFDRCIWHPEVTEAELLVEAGAILPDVGLLDMFKVTSLHNRVMRLANGSDLAKAIIEGWLKAFRQNHPPGEEPDFDLDFNVFGQPLHPEIEAEVNAVQARRQSAITILDVCRRVREQRSWGKREEALMKAVTPATYEATIRSHVGEDLKLLLLQSMDFFKKRPMYDPHFGGATQSFLDACKAITTQDPNSRLSKLLFDLFCDAGRGSELEVNT